MTGVVDLGPDAASLLEAVLDPHPEAGGVAARGPAHVHPRLYVGLHPLVHGGPEDGAIVDVGVEGEVPGRVGVAQGHVVLHQLGLAAVVHQLEARQPALVLELETKVI